MVSQYHNSLAYFIPSLLSVACICPVNNMRAVLEEAAVATATNQWLSQFFSPIILPQPRLVVLCWHGVNLLIETPGDFRDSQQCYSTKDSRHSICWLKRYALQNDEGKLLLLYEGTQILFYEYFLAS